jgi:hypothetical protein
MTWWTRTSRWAAVRSWSIRLQRCSTRSTTSTVSGRYHGILRRSGQVAGQIVQGGSAGQHSLGDTGRVQRAGQVQHRPGKPGGLGLVSLVDGQLSPDFYHCSGIGRFVAL